MKQVTNLKSLDFTWERIAKITGSFSCVTDGCWFSSISHFAMFTKSISNCTIFVDKLTAWQVCVMSESKPNLLNLNVSIVS